VDGVEWKHPIELPTGKRAGQRVVIYPPELDRLQAVLSSERSALDVAVGQEEACERIVSARDNFDHPPMIFSTNQEELKHHVDPSKIDEWTTTSSQIATGSRRQVPKNGPDVMNSESDSDNEQHGDQLDNAYVDIPTDSNGYPKGSGHKVTNDWADQARRTAKGEAAQDKNGQKGPLGGQQAQAAQKSGHPMMTRSEERAAGGARVAAGSG
jgi:hypothetical protein